MKCPERDVLLELAFSVANGEDMPPETRAIFEHVHDCETCRRSLEDDLRVLRLSRRHFDSTTPPTGQCLDDNRLAEYLDGRLSSEARTQTELHLAACSHCLRELVEFSEIETLATTSEQVEAEPNAVQGAAAAVRYVLAIKQGVMEWLEHPQIGFTLLRPALDAVLGSQLHTITQGSCGWTQESQGRRVRFVATCSQDDLITLAVTLHEHPTPHQVRFDLFGHGRLIQSEAFSASGDILIQRLPVGEYRGMVVYSPDEQVAFTLVFEPRNT